MPKRTDSISPRLIPSPPKATKADTASEITIDEIQTSIIDFIKSLYEDGIKKGSIPNIETNFLLKGNLKLTELDIVDIAMDLEEKYHIEFTDAEIDGIITKDITAVGLAELVLRKSSERKAA